MKLMEVWSNFNKTAKLLLVVVGIALVVSLIHSLTAESKAERWRDDYEAWRDTAEVRAEQADSLRELADSAEMVANTSQAAADSIRGEIQTRDRIILDMQAESDSVREVNDSTFDELVDGRPEEEVVTASSDETKPWVRLTFDLREEIWQLASQVKVFEIQVDDYRTAARKDSTTIGSLRASLFFQTARADTLERSVITIPPAPPRERLLGIIPLPSRKTSFLVGLGVGIVTYIAVDKFLFGDDNVIVASQPQTHMIRPQFRVSIWP